MRETIKQAPVWLIATVAASLLVLLLLFTPTAQAPAVPAPGGGAALRVALDPETGEVVPVTGLDKAALAQQMQQMLNRSADGLHEERLADGGVTIDLAGRFQSLLVATVDSTGQLSTDCLASARDLAQMPCRHAHATTHDGETE